jgi:hypothetical protein
MQSVQNQGIQLLHDVIQIKEPIHGIEILCNELIKIDASS